MNLKSIDELDNVELIEKVMILGKYGDDILECALTALEKKWEE